ncbi:MAG TPA: hypothetical protein VFE14_15480 [Micromonosporaceae bacterium]|nr:hypothetical protein [Micromonosporaceae bacterium]
MLAEAFHLGQLYACYQDASELLWVIVDRGTVAALESEDPVAIGRAAWGQTYLYRDYGLLAEAHQVVEDAMRHIDAARETPALLRQRSAVLLASAMNHARERRAALAWRAWDLAAEAERACGLPPSPVAGFGASVPDVALAIDVEIGRSASAVRRAESVDIDAVPSIPRRARLAVEIARAYLGRREYHGRCTCCAGRTTPRRRRRCGICLRARWRSTWRQRRVRCCVGTRLSWPRS